MASEEGRSVGGSSAKAFITPGVSDIKNTGFRGTRVA